jgi:hypothetical protein
MNCILIVTRAFADYKVGDQITDQSVIAGILDTTNHANVVKTSPSAAPAALN